ncbi:MAG: hypothetical protein A3G81_04185 [Betaproteobacteria bacterium RIFCSPLOWO2_12_FULL_65_14]|nr:MAG: hypothetical protein A3G81_04185 [Betaproteobacteria bacterium RIFCSPLOWO2_12_FULL_65_14]
MRLLTIAGIAGAATSPIDVRVANGVVTLRGSVKRAERDLALAVALAVPGVTQVANQFEVVGEAPEVI